jgi:hypothetical protein
MIVRKIQFRCLLKLCDLILLEYKCLVLLRVEYPSSLFCRSKHVT